jgi:predicted metal-dependent phosphoesterase TrpH
MSGIEPTPRPPKRRQYLQDDAVTPLGPSRVDLHTHTTRSDGILDPRDLVEAASAAGVRVLAITDHDTLAGYREITAVEAAPLPDGLLLIPGVEINAVTREVLDVPDGELHVLGYGVDPDDEAFEDALARQRDARRIRFGRTVDRLRALGYPIDAQVEGLDPTDDDALGRPTLARCLIAAGYATSVEDAFRRLLGRGAPGYVPREGLGPIDAIHTVRAAGGLPSLAHFGEAPAHVSLLGELQEAGLAGLEVYYRTFGASTVAAVGAVAERLGLLPTGGSDYHGDTGTYAEQHADLWVPPEVGDSLMAEVGRTAVGRAPVGR